MKEKQKLILYLNKLEATEADGWENAKSKSCCPGDDWADGYNAAVQDITKFVSKSLALK